jgi:hypothetical protein
MRIEFSSQELQQALKAYVENRGFKVENIALKHSTREYDPGYSSEFGVVGSASWPVENFYWDTEAHSGLHAFSMAVVGEPIERVEQ